MIDIQTEFGYLEKTKLNLYGALYKEKVELLRILTREIITEVSLDG